MAQPKRLPKVKPKGKRGFGNLLPTNSFSWPQYISKIFPIFFLIIATLVVFWPVQNHEFINLDDDEYVFENPNVQSGLTSKSVIWAFTNTSTGNWHPLTWLSHMLDCELFGLNPGSHHFISLLFHLANTLLLFWLLKKITRKPWVSGFVAALFALHPLHVESVAWVAERKDVLSAFFWLLTLGMYVRYIDNPGLSRYLLTLLFFILGLMSKPMLVTLPFVLLLLDYWPLGRIFFGKFKVDTVSPKTKTGHNQGRSPMYLVLEKAPFFILSAAFSVLAFLAQRNAGAVGSLERFPLESRVANAIVSYARYIEKMVWPQDLAVLYPFPHLIPTWQVAAAGIFLLGISLFVISFARTRPYLFVGWFWYLGTLVPVIGLVQLGIQAMADRFTYVPYVGLFIMIAMGVPDIFKGWRHQKTALVVSSLLVLSSSATIAILQVHRWQNSIPLFEHTLAVTSNNFIIHNNLGVVLAQQGKIQEAAFHYRQALQIKPDHLESLNNLAIALAQQGNFHEATLYYRQALQIKPDHLEALNNLAIALAQQGNFHEATEYYTRALLINPNFAETRNNLGVALAQQGKTIEASAQFVEALRIKPTYAEAHYNLGNVLAQEGKFQEAIGHFTQALRIKPNYVDALFSLGLAYATIGNRQSALEEYKKLKMINLELGNTLYDKIITFKESGLGGDESKKAKEGLRTKQ
jgi:protein O-mannosyl-transferase